jgi:hypothetical protein
VFYWRKVLRTMDAEMFGDIEAKATFTGNLKNGIKDGIRDEWCEAGKESDQASWREGVSDSDDEKGIGQSK